MKKVDLLKKMEILYSQNRKSRRANRAPLKKKKNI